MTVRMDEESKALSVWAAWRAVEYQRDAIYLAAVRAAEAVGGKLSLEDLKKTPSQADVDADPDRYTVVGKVLEIP